MPVIRPKVTETTALGAAYATGFWSGLDELRNNWAQDKVWRPHMEASARTKGIDNWRKAVRRTLDWVD